MSSAAPPLWATLYAEVAHDVRNSLGTILLNAQMLEGEPLSEDGQHMVSLIEKATRHARSLLDRLGRYQSPRADAGPCDMVAVVQDGIDFFARYARREGIEVIAALPETLLVPGPPADLLAMVVNLLQNAFQMAPKSVRVELQQAGGQAVLRIEDDGPGVAPEDVPRLFQAGFTRRDGGSGLGLPSVLETARSRGGTARYEPSPSGGARFEVTMRGV